MALSQSQGFSTIGAQTIVDNFAIEFAMFNFAVEPPTPSTVVASVDQTLFEKLATPPAVDSVQAAVTASMPPAATIGGAAEVRAAEGTPTSSAFALIVDFQALRTVSEIAGPAEIESVAAWLGTKFDVDPGLSLTWSIDRKAVTFQEVQTERLLVTFASKVSPADLAASGSVVIPTLPSNLELLVNGTRAWFKSGTVPSNPYSEQNIDLTSAVASAAASGQAIVTFRTAAPASLVLALTATLNQRYIVAFPEGAVRTVDAPTEGVYPLSLPISTETVKKADVASRTPDGWTVKGVVLGVSAKIPDVRVQPADGPEPSTDAELLLDPDHPLVVRLPPAATDQLSAVSGVRLLVSVGTDGAELAGTLVADAPVSLSDGTTRDEPGDPIPKAALGPVTLTASDTPAWVDLALAAPHKLAGSEHLWLELQVARGSLVWKLAEIPADDHEKAELRRRTPSGKYVELSTFGDLAEYVAALRVVGQEKANNPLAAVTAAVVGAPDTVAGVPTQAGTTLNLGIKRSEGVAPSPVASGDFEVPLELTIATPGSYAITSAELQYTQTSGG